MIINIFYVLLYYYNYKYTKIYSTYFAMFCTMFDLITIWSTNNTWKIMHPSWEQPKRGEILPLL